MKISVAAGDGIGNEIMTSVLTILAATSAPLEYNMVKMGKLVALAGEPTGISGEARRSVESTGVLLKGPVETPVGPEFKSLNVTARKLWGTFANKRVFRTLPGVPSVAAGRQLDLTIVRENIEDTYGAIEHMQTHDVAQCRRLITRPGCQQLHEYVFEMAARKGAGRVTCGHKASVMKLTDGMFLETFYEVARKFPTIQADDVLTDELAMRLVLDAGEFDVIVLPNLQGDILTDMTAGLVGGLAYSPSANIGDGICIFEPAHGAAPQIAGKDLANPTALLLSATMMLRHLGLVAHASAIEIALNHTLLKMHQRRDLMEPIPIFRTSRFTELMLEDLARLHVPEVRNWTVETAPRPEPVMKMTESTQRTALRGIDVFVQFDSSPARLVEKLEQLDLPLPLTMVSNRGTQVWPTGSAHTDCVNHYRLRFASDGTVEQAQLLSVLSLLGDNFSLCGSEWLRDFDGQPAYSRAQSGDSVSAAAQSAGHSQTSVHPRRHP